ncbi:MAG: hypothetical protein U1C19_00425 [Methanobacteriaceae archaeon]|nr:hypothetical protein [Methanobacteriaceae archaeon]
MNIFYDNEPDGSDYTSFSQEQIYTNIYNLNHPNTVRDFQRLIKSPLTNNETLYKHLTRISADNVTKIISEKETERVLKNLQYIEKTLQQTQLDITKYNAQASKLSSTVSRQNILERSLLDGKMYNGRELSYKELNNLSKDLEQYKQTRIEDQLWQDANKEAAANGFDPVKTHKVWIWSALENTRHMDMDEETVPINEMFTVVNEVTGDTDQLRFPRDIENDSNGCSNICNCQCDVEYI